MEPKKWDFLGGLGQFHEIVDQLSALGCRPVVVALVNRDDELEVAGVEDFLD